MTVTSSPATATEVCAIVVTYNPDDSSLECVRTIAETAAYAIIVDNRSKEQSMQKLRELKSAKTTLLENPANTGVAAGLNLGIRTAANKGYRWFLLFDQDTKLLPGTIENLIRVYQDCQAELGPKLGMLGSNYYHLCEDGTIFEAKVPWCDGKPWSVEDLVITSGTLISWKNFEIIGPFREDFFIDHVDHDYQLRAKHLGLVVARSALPLMIHRLGMLHVRRAWLAFGARKMLSFYSPLRRYYQIRNFLVLAREHEKEFPEIIDFIRKSIWRETSRALRYEGCFFANFMSVLLALRHSQRGVTGKYSGSIAL